MAFEHAYATTADFSWFGSSAKSDDAAEEDEEGLISVLRAPDGTEQAFPPGEPLVLPLSEWLTLANVRMRTAAADAANARATGCWHTRVNTCTYASPSRH